VIETGASAAQSLVMVRLPCVHGPEKLYTHARGAVNGAG
jgi:hypothetical protein